MCLHTKQLKPFTAKKDIHVFKLVCKLLFSDDFRSPFQSFIYTVNEFNRTELLFSKSVSSFDPIATSDRDSMASNGIKFITISSGFHAISTKLRVKTTNISELTLIDAIIPKGSLYYKDNTGLIVSNQIIITNKAFDIKELTKNIRLNKKK